MKRFLALVAMVTLLAGCGASAAGTQKAVPKGGSGTSATSKTPAKRIAKLTPVKLSITVQTLGYAPVFIALGGGLFKKEGLKVQAIQTGGGSQGMTALESGSVQFDTTDSGTVAVARSHGVNAIEIEALTNRVVLNLVIRKALAEQRHLSRRLPLMERLKALKGMKIGITGPGAATDVFTRYYLEKAGLVPNKDTQLVAVGSAPALLASLKEGQIDGFMLAPPIPEMAVAGGYGTMLVDATKGDVPALSQFAYNAVDTTTTYAKTHPQVVRAFAHAVALGNRMMHDNPAEALKILSHHFSKINPVILKRAFKDILPAFPANGRFTATDWVNAIQVAQQTGLLKRAVSPKEGVLWTNRFVS